MAEGFTLRRIDQGWLENRIDYYIKSGLWHHILSQARCSVRRTLSYSNAAVLFEDTPTLTAAKISDETQDHIVEIMTTHFRNLQPLEPIHRQLRAVEIVLEYLCLDYGTIFY